MQLSKNFRLAEFACKCKERGFYEQEPSSYCGGLAVVHPELVQALQKLRDYLTRPIIVTSGYRCPAYNRRPPGRGGVGGAEWSYHMRGMAADIVVAGLSPQDVAELAEEIVDLGGLKAYDGFTHIDIRAGEKWRG